MNCVLSFLPKMSNHSFPWPNSILVIQNKWIKQVVNSMKCSDLGCSFSVTYEYTQIKLLLTKTNLSFTLIGDNFSWKFLHWILIFYLFLLLTSTLNIKLQAPVRGKQNIFEYLELKCVMRACKWEGDSGTRTEPQVHNIPTPVSQNWSKSVRYFTLAFKNQSNRKYIWDITPQFICPMVKLDRN